MNRQEGSPLTVSKKPRFFHGYIVVIAGFIIMMIMFGAMYSFGVFFKPLLNEFGWTRTMVSGAYTLLMVLSGGTNILTGRLSDRFGPRLVVTACGCVLGLGYLLMSQTSTIWQLYLFFGALVGIGMGSFAPIVSEITRWFDKTKGLMTGIVVAGIGAGTIIMPPVANQLISIYDWRTSYIILGCIALITIVIAAQLLGHNPSQIGLPANSVNKEKVGTLDLGTKGFTLREAISAKQLWILCIIHLFSNLCIQAIMVHFVPHATDIGISVVIAASILSTIGALSIVGKIVIGGASDRIGSKLSLIIVFVIMSAALFWLLAAKELWMFYLFAVIFGFGYGGAVSLQSPPVYEIFGLKAHGAILGVVVFSATIGGGIGSLVVGRIFDITGNYQLAFLVCAVLSIIGLILASILRFPRREPLHKPLKTKK